MPHKTLHKRVLEPIEPSSRPKRDNVPIRLSPIVLVLGFSPSARKFGRRCFRRYEIRVHPATFPDHACSVWVVNFSATRIRLTRHSSFVLPYYFVLAPLEVPVSSRQVVYAQKRRSTRIDK